MYEHVFKELEPAHVRYGFGSLKKGEITRVEVAGASEASKIRGAAGAHGQYHGKRFSTRTADGFLYIKRVK